MILFIFLLVVLFAASFNSGRKLAALQKQKDQDPAAVKSVVIEDVPKFCPPHKWFHQEVKDQEGATVRWRIVCEICGPIKLSSGPARTQ